MVSYPIILEFENATKAVGVIVPDLPGCYSSGDDYDDAIANAEEAILLHLECLAEDGDIPPTPSKLTRNFLEQYDFSESTEVLLALVSIDPTPFMGKSEKVNVTLPKYMTYMIDRCVDSNKLYKSRSNFIQQSVFEKLQNIEKVRLVQHNLQGDSEEQKAVG